FEGRLDHLDVPPREGGLKDLAGGQSGGIERPLGPIGMARQADLTVANIQFFQLHVLATEIRRISQDHHGIPITPPPLDIDPMTSCMVIIRSRTLSAGTGRIPARIFSRVSSTVFPSGTRGRATTEITDWIPPFSSWKARMTRFISKRTRGSWISGGN